MTPTAHLTARLLAPPGSTRTAIDVALGQVPLVVLSQPAWPQLVAECGSAEKATRWLSRLATRRRRPIGVHQDGQTLWLAPDGWSDERLQGYVLAQREPLEAAFGPIVRWEMVR
jgi:hypothetical protein